MRMLELNKKLVSNKEAMKAHRNKMILKSTSLETKIMLLAVKIHKLNVIKQRLEEDNYQVTERIACINGHLDTCRMIKL